MNPVIEERLAKIDELHLDEGAHSTFEEGYCFNEAVAWLAGEPHSDSPKCVSPVLRSYTMRLNDGLPDELRQELKPFMARCVGTAGDGHDELRVWMCVGWTAHTALPVWLELAGLDDAAQLLRALPPIDSADAYQDARQNIRDMRGEIREARTAARKHLTERVQQELEKKGYEAAAAAAAAVAVAADVAAAAEAAVAAAADVAVAAAADVAVAADVTVAAAAEAAVAADAAGDSWGNNRAYAAAENAAKSVIEERIRPQSEALFPLALDLLDKLIDPTTA